MMATSAANLGLRPRPSLSACAARLARCGRPGGALEPGATIPRIEAYATIAADHQRLAELRDLTGEGEGPFAPITWPHVVATPLHLHLITAPEFPLPALGLVHVRQVIVQTLPIPARAELHVRCRVDGQRRSGRGVEVDLVTEAALRPGTPAIWRGITTARWRGAGGREGGPALRGPGAALAGDGERWRIADDVGRRYARCSRGFDPEDLHAHTARWFGFQRPVVPAMWTLARCLAALEAAARLPLRIEARFSAPIFVPGEVLFTRSAGGELTRFAVLPPPGDRAGRPHLEGSLSRL